MATLASMQGMAKVPFTLGNTFDRWSLGPFALFVIGVSLALAIWYLRADWSLAGRGRSWSRGRTSAFLAGLLVVDLAFCSSVPLYANTYFQAHVIQHLMLMVVAPALLALGTPSTLLLQTASRPVKERWLKVLHSDGFAALSHPVAVFFLYYGAMFAFFLTPLIGFAMAHMAVMDVINVFFLLGGTLYWWPMISLDPIVHWKMSYGFRLINILIGGGVEAFLGVAILNNSQTVASIYTLASSHSGGALLWVSTEFASLGAFLPIYIQWMRSEDREAARADRRLDRAEREEQDRPAGAEGMEGPPPLALPALTPPANAAWAAAFAAKAGRVPSVQHRAPTRPEPPLA